MLAALSDAPEEQARSGVAPPFAQVFQDTAPFVWRAVRRLGVHHSDVEDVCQEVFLTVHRRLPSFEGRSSIRTWIYGICVRTVADWRKRTRRRREDVVEAPPDAGAPEHQLDDLGRRQALARLQAILDELDDDKRAVFVLFELEEVPMSEVAEAVGCPLQTAYARLYAARKQVEAAMRRAELGRG